MFSCGLTQELDPTSSQKYHKISPKDSGNSSPPSRWGFAFRSNSNSLILGRQEVSVDALMQRMRSLSQKQSECSETELNDRFKTVEMQVNEHFYV